MTRVSRADRHARRRRPVALALLCALLVIVLAACTPSDGGSVPPVVGPFPRPTAPSASVTPATPSSPVGPATPGSTSPSDSPADVEEVEAALRTQTLDQASDVLDRLILRAGPDDPRYYSDGTWHDGDSACFRCHYGPAALSAAYGVAEDDPTARRRAVRSLSLAISEKQAGDGSFNTPGVADGSGIETIFFGVLLAQTYLTLGDQLDKGTARAWRASLASAARYLESSGWTSWYANGNIVLAQTVFFDLAGRILQSRSYARQADQLYEFLLAPPQDRWAGFGLTYTTHPVKADGSDGAAFLAEKGTGFPGFDPVYAMLQLGFATDWFVLTRDDRALRLSNLLINQLLPRVRTSDWTLDVSGGTRRGRPDERYGFTSSALPVLALLGGRRDLLDDVASQASVRGKTYRDATGFVSPGNSYSFGLEVGVLLLALRE